MLLDISTDTNQFLVLNLETRCKIKTYKTYDSFNEYQISVSLDGLYNAFT